MTTKIKPEDDEVLNEVLESTLRVSQLVYQYVNLRQIVHKHDERYADPKSKHVKVRLNRPALIVTTKAEEDHGIHNFQNTTLKHEITPISVLQFMEENTDNLTWSKSGYIDFKESDDDNNMQALTNVAGMQEKIKQLADHYDADIVEFNDKHAHECLRSELVFSIIVNRTEKRITVVFRGSVSLKDWLIDGLGIIRRTEPQIVKDFTKRGVRFHGGFSRYLFGKSRIKSNDETKFHEIVDILREIYNYKNEDNGRDYSDYELYITGHSLGGGLAQLLAFTLAGMKDELAFLPEEKPITAITYASPEAGNRRFRNNFTELEKEGKLRHIRVSNHGDAVPIIFKYLFYKQTGLNIHVYDGTDKRHTAVGYNSVVGFWINPFKAGLMHGLSVYYQRLFTSENNDILTMGMEAIYNKFAGFSRLEE